MRKAEAQIQNFNEENQLYTVDEVSAMLRLDRLTLMKLIQENELKYVKIGRQYRIMKNDLIDFLNSHKK